MTPQPAVDLAAEQGVLGGMLLSASAITEVAAILEPTDFYKPAHELIYRVILDLHAAGVPADAVTAAAELSQRGELGRVDGAPYLHTLMSSVPTAANAGYYAVIVRDRSIRRRAVELSTRLGHAVDVDQTTPDDLLVVIAKIRDEFSELVAPTGEAVSPHLAAIPDYPADLIPGPLGRLVKAAASAGLPQALVGGAGLAVLGTVTGKSSVDVYPGGLWRESPSLWVPLIAPPGAGKTPAKDFAYRPLEELDADERARFVEKMVGWNDADGGEKPQDLTRLQEDITTEMVVRWLASGDGTGGIAPDELANFLRSLGRYRSGGDGGDRARWLSNWSHKQWPYMRVTGNVNLLVRRPVISICGGLQPALHSLLGPEDDGFRARWLPHMAPLDPTLRPGRPDEYARALWNDVVGNLYGNRATREWRLGGLDSPAFKLWSEARDRWKRQATAGSESASTTGALSKADIQAARIALALAESMSPGRPGVIPDEAMLGAIAIVDYTLDCWRTLPGHQALALSHREQILNPAVDQLASWLEAHGGKATVRQLLRGAVAGVRTAAALEALLSHYEQIYPQSIRTEKTGSRGPAARVVYAPRRGSLEIPKDTGTGTVSADSFQGE